MPTKKFGSPGFSVLLVLTVLAGLILWGVGAWNQTKITDEPVFEGSAREQLHELEVKGRAPRTGYSREEFGPRWADVDGNGCDTRNDILNRDLGEIRYRDNSGCVIATGVLVDPYTNEVIEFTRGQDTSAEVQIDHVVALSDAWQKGAQELSERQRTELANDPLNLLAVSGPANQQKSDHDASGWLPSYKPFRCEFVSIQVAVKHRYDLWMTPAEFDTIDTLLARDCPDQPAYTGP